MAYKCLPKLFLIIMCILNLQINRFFCFANLQGVITVLFCVGGTNSVRAELIPTCMDDDGTEGVCERMGDDDGETGQKEFVKVWVVMMRQRGQVNMHFCASHFLALSLCPSVCLSNCRESLCFQ